MSEEEISIKVNIGDRFYPLRIKLSEEEKVRKAAKLINERAKFYIETYSVQDKQDALAMVALELASKEASDTLSDSEYNHLDEQLDRIQKKLDS